MKIGTKEFDTVNKTYVMGILNVTPDSFSDGGKFNQMDKALKHVEEMLAEGMDIVDIGGESTRPGYTLLSDEEEIERVVPVIEAVKKNFDVPVSLDTYKAKVAQAGIRAGADLINDIWGLRYEKEWNGKTDDSCQSKMAEVIAKAGVPCCLMHNRKQPDYTNYMKDVMTDLKETIEVAKRAGIAEDKIILDPGVGFGKTYENNLEIINSLEKLRELGYPVLLGTSRKSVIGLTLDLPAAERVEGTLVTTVFGVWKGCSFVRVHDIKENVRAIKMAEAILNSTRGNK